MSYTVTAVIAGFPTGKANQVSISLSPDELDKFCFVSRTPKPYVNRCVKEIGHVREFRIAFDSCFEEKLKAYMGTLCDINIRPKYYKFNNQAGATIQGYKFHLDSIEQKK